MLHYKAGVRWRTILWCRPAVVAIVLTVAALSGTALAGSRLADVPPGDLDFSFSHAPYIHPKIIQDLTTWMSDSGDQIVAINLSDSQASNRYFGEIQIRDEDGSHPFVTIKDSNGGFGYQYIGTTDSGVHVIYTSEWGGGSGVFKRIMLLTFEYDEGLRVDWKKSVIRTGERRVLIWKRGGIGLGDRWDGELRVEGNQIFIGKDRGWFTFSGGTGGGQLSYDRQDKTLSIDAARQDGNKATETPSPVER